jgi:hypothetical protein
MTKILPFCLLLLACTASPADDDDDTGDCDLPQMVYPDSDGDGFGDDAAAALRCEMPAGFVAKGGDCADDNKDVHPDAKEVCDAVDNNCDGKIDDADPALDTTTGTVFYRDTDADGYGDEAHSKSACAKPSGYTAEHTDCDDAKAAVHPGAAEVCDQIDNDCDQLIDTADSSVTGTLPFYRDLDHDNVGAGTATYACDAPSGYVASSNDCNDNDNLTYPGAAEICDGGDNDCDGGIDGTLAQPNQCTALVGTYAGSYTHLTQEKVGSTVVNSVQCTGTGNAALMLDRKPGLQGTFACTYSGSLGGFSHNQSVTLMATVGLDGTVKGTVDHVYNPSDNLHRVYNVTGTQTANSLTLSGTGSWYPNAMSAVPWQVNFSFTTSR